jgi:aspartate ammonia-lyase
LGYERASEIARQVAQSGRSVREVVLEQQLLSASAFDQLVSPEAVCRLGLPADRRGTGE